MAHYLNYEPNCNGVFIQEHLHLLFCKFGMLLTHFVIIAKTITLLSPRLMESGGSMLHSQGLSKIPILSWINPITRTDTYFSKNCSQSLKSLNLVLLPYKCFYHSKYQRSCSFCFAIVVVNDQSIWKFLWDVFGNNMFLQFLLDSHSASAPLWRSNKNKLIHGLWNPEV